jgi:hypothetical protein
LEQEVHKLLEIMDLILDLVHLLKLLVAVLVIQKDKITQFGQKLAVLAAAEEVFIQLLTWQAQLELLDKEILEEMVYRLVHMQAAQVAEVLVQQELIILAKETEHLLEAMVGQD